MSHLVVDASVVLKWLLAEALSDRAEALLEDSLHAGTVIVGPPHLTGEVANALYRRIHRSQNSITQDEAEDALARFLAIPIQVVSSDELYTGAFAFALQYGLSSLYDSLYVVLAELLGGQLWTDDRRLLNTIGQAAPWVRPIADY